MTKKSLNKRFRKGALRINIGGSLNRSSKRKNNQIEHSYKVYTSLDKRGFWDIDTKEEFND